MSEVESFGSPAAVLEALRKKQDKRAQKAKSKPKKPEAAPAMSFESELRATLEKRKAGGSTAATSPKKAQSPKPKKQKEPKPLSPKSQLSQRISARRQSVAGEEDDSDGEWSYSD
eukprot:TRINITY_DN24069_c0_g1_i1.p1 TRINITY_DN24069_c0_g1~~TRINITY_DN24069_c0_g1_i1.p1  ORF type:complete len:115 (-),score=34.89 TRINITY_DN24069_c0_g1_i1:255-599(-)